MTAGSLAACLIAALVFMSLMFLMARRIKRYDLVDAAWGMAFIVVALTSYLIGTGGMLLWGVNALVTFLVIVWGGRLAQHILRRIVATNTEDARYVELRKTWKGNVSRNIFFRIYMLQAVLALIISSSVIHINLSQDVDWSVYTTIGALVWLLGFIFESVSDCQLRQFVTNPKNKGLLMNRGLWKYSRHPNYFGELTQWWGIFIICLGVPYGLVGIVGPLLLGYLIIFVSGIPMNEKRFEGRSGWAEYKKRTSMLIPSLPVHR